MSLLSVGKHFPRHRHTLLRLSEVELRHPSLNKANTRVCPTFYMTVKKDKARYSRQPRNEATGFLFPAIPCFPCFHVFSSSCYFSNRVIRHWNKHPKDVVEGKTIASFKNRVDRYFVSVGLNETPVRKRKRISRVRPTVHMIVKRDKLTTTGNCAMSQQAFC